MSLHGRGSQGCEWSVLPDVPLQVLKRFRMIVMEAHWLEKQET